ncbi:MAG: hypothetical protein FWG63_06500 [Defluviitaleaceae bacterium]|nr:hypothetical protein [Defluviitaleaceae bacterium]
MTNKIYTVKEIKNIATPVFKEHGIEKVIIFDSYAQERASRNSTIDFAFTEANGMKVDSGKVESELMIKFGKVIRFVWLDDKGLIADVEYAEDGSEDILRNIKENGIIIYV